jgi:hypothetical protein
MTFSQAATISARAARSSGSLVMAGGAGSSVGGGREFAIRRLRYVEMRSEISSERAVRSEVWLVMFSAMLYLVRKFEHAGG